MNKLKKYLKTENKIEELRSVTSALTDDELKTKTAEFKNRLNNGETLDDIKIEAFAVVREATKRALGLEHYPVQLIGGLAIHDGNIAELKTGEGKSITCYPPAYLNCLTGDNVHIVTVNDYLAYRDATDARKVMEMLGISVGCALANDGREQHKEAYECDITYVTNSEAGFDYLRDNMVKRVEDRVQRGLSFCIIDEADSILIDEARTPLIISGQGTTPSEFYTKCDTVAKRLKKGTYQKETATSDAKETGDYYVDEKEKTAVITERGIKKIEKYLGINNYSDEENADLRHGIVMALKANAVMEKGKDYIVREDKVEIVDEFTGRVLDGRRFSDGLHQAIEAKEGVKIQTENMTLATITYQHFFNKYQRKSGMTGTAMTEKSEFKDIYHMDVIPVPTNKPVIRIDEDDRIFLTQKEKFHAILEEAKKANAKGQPILIGTADVETSELLSRMFDSVGLNHQVLNAKRHAYEAEIVSHAGEHSSITIATNMAGRGTDIKLDDEARAAGGLLVIGTEHHEARRIDNQLRGRSGRQGDPGRSIFFISLEDSLIRTYANETFVNKLKQTGLPDPGSFGHKTLSKVILKSQIKIEAHHYGIRKSLLEYDDVNNEQRELIYSERNKILNGNDPKETVIKMAEFIAEDVYEKYKDDQEAFGRHLDNTFGIMAEDDDVTDIRSYLAEIPVNGYERLEKELPIDGAIASFAREVLLQVIDKYWTTHLDELDHLKEGITGRAYGQKDPKVEYRREAYDLFDNMLRSIRGSSVSIIYRAKVSKCA